MNTYFDDVDPVNELDCLSKTGEISLRGDISPIVTAYRYTWYGWGNCRFIRLSQDNEGCSLIHGSNRPLRKEIPIRLDEWDSLINPIHAFGFRKMSTTDMTIGLDGHDVLLEGVDYSGYHYMTRWVPTINMKERHLTEFVDTLNRWEQFVADKGLSEGY